MARLPIVGLMAALAGSSVAAISGQTNVVRLKMRLVNPNLPLPGARPAAAWVTAAREGGRAPPALTARLDDDRRRDGRRTGVDHDRVRARCKRMQDRNPAMPDG
jgi:hypothetical protein